MFTDHVDISQVFVQGDLLVIVAMSRYTHLVPQVTLRTPTFVIYSVNPCTTFPQQIGSDTLI